MQQTPSEIRIKAAREVRMNAIAPRVMDEDELYDWVTNHLSGPVAKYMLDECIQVWNQHYAGKTAREIQAIGG